jgi:hypothetical protein
MSNRYSASVITPADTLPVVRLRSRAASLVLLSSSAGPEPPLDGYSNEQTYSAMPETTLISKPDLPGTRNELPAS